MCMWGILMSTHQKSFSIHDLCLFVRLWGLLHSVCLQHNKTSIGNLYTTIIRNATSTWSSSFTAHITTIQGNVQYFEHFRMFYSVRSVKCEKWDEINDIVENGIKIHSASNESFGGISARKSRHIIKMATRKTNKIWKWPKGMRIKRLKKQERSEPTKWRSKNNKWWKWNEWIKKREGKKQTWKEKLE